MTESTTSPYSVRSVKPVRVLGISGSLRAGSYNTKLLQMAKKLAPRGMKIEIYDISRLPFYNADLDGENKPPAVVDFRKAVIAADALLIATPEYNYSVPGVLKNAIDWASRPPGKSPLYRKAIAIMGATTGMWGTVRAQLHLRQILLYSRAHIVLEPEILVAQAGKKFDEHDNLVDEDTSKYIVMLLEGLADVAVQKRE